MSHTMFVVASTMLAIAGGLTFIRLSKGSGRCRTA